MLNLPRPPSRLPPPPPDSESRRTAVSLLAPPRVPRPVKPRPPRLPPPPPRCAYSRAARGSGLRSHGTAGSLAAASWGPAPRRSSMRSAPSPATSESGSSLSLRCGDGGARLKPQK
eukprot:scaffold72287_cov63-Phaeocystis_antarctica.AAC.2